MEGIEKITAKIAEDAQAEVNRLMAETGEKVKAIQTSAAAQAQQEANEIVEKGRMAASERLERLSSAAQMERRKLELSAKQEVLGEAFDLALSKLCALPEKDYIDLLTKLALEASSSGKERLIFSQKDRNKVGKQVVIAANEALVKERVPALPEEVTKSKVGAFVDKLVHSTTAAVTGAGMLTLAEETRDIQGGFIMVDGDVEINCAFETLVRLQREKLERKVADALFA
ncbi:V-type proton ATPase subunit E [Firmicutes bacterium ASF500]|nr:V-type proton ATPase subunit E [Firmicutes bacterium ASF500]